MFDVVYTCFQDLVYTENGTFELGKSRRSKMAMCSKRKKNQNPCTKHMKRAHLIKFRKKQ